MRAYVPTLDIRSALHAAVFTSGLAVVLWICGCTATAPAHPPATTATDATATTANSTAAAPAGAPAPPQVPAAPFVAADETEPAAITPTPVAPAPAAVPPVVKAKKPAAAAVPRSKPEVPTAVTPPVASAPAAVPVPAPPAASAPLDLNSLKQRLRDTNAIGVFTKLALKNQVDDLLDKFRQFYSGKLKIALPQLRQSYELLVQKVLVLLQDNDPVLAKQVAASREAIWGLLADPQKFATL